MFCRRCPGSSREMLLGVIVLCFAMSACSSSDSQEPTPTLSTEAGGAGGSAGSMAVGGDAGANAGGAPARCEDTPSPAPIACTKNSARFITHIVAHEFGPGQTTGQDDFPEPVLGPPQGAGCCRGATSGIVSLGNGGWVIVGFQDNGIVDQPGPDFIVFENAFFVGGSEANVFAELATVAVSDDGVHWVEFPCSASELPYGQCAGWHPTLANAAENELDPLDPALAGGDAFDLADVCLPRARYVRITDRPDLDASLDGVFDLDAVAIVHAACPE